MADVFERRAMALPGPGQTSHKSRAISVFEGRVELPIELCQVLWIELKNDEAIAAYPTPVREGLTALRKPVLDTARETPGVGPITQDLRWGQPSFITQATGSGTTIRIDRLRGKPEKFAIFFRCRTGLVDQFRAIYDDKLTFIGNRAIELGVSGTLPVPELKHCIALALTYHLRKRKRKKCAPKTT